MFTKEQLQLLLEIVNAQTFKGEIVEEVYEIKKILNEEISN